MNRHKYYFFAIILLLLAALVGCKGVIVTDTTTEAAFEKLYDIGGGDWKPFDFSDYRFGDAVFENGFIEIEGELVDGTILLTGTVRQRIFRPDESWFWDTDSFQFRGGFVPTASTDPYERLYRVVVETVNVSGFGWGENEDAFRVMLDNWLHWRESVMESQNGQLKGTSAYIRTEINLLATSQ